MKECLETINGIISDYVYGKIDAGGLKKNLWNFSLCPLYSGNQHSLYLEKSEYAVTANELKNQSDIPIQLFLFCIGYQ